MKFGLIGLLMLAASPAALAAENPPEFRSTATSIS